VSYLWYFAYGSNADPERFRSRVGPWEARLPATVEGLKLTFSARVESEGGGGAVVVESSASRVYGVAYRITTEQMQAMDAEEFDPGRDLHGSGRRITVTAASGPRSFDAELYTISPAGDFRAPSERYLGHILRGLRHAGHGDEVLREVRGSALAEGTPPGGAR
jgi:hypothetical protein